MQDIYIKAASLPEGWEERAIAATNVNTRRAPPLHRSGRSRRERGGGASRRGARLRAIAAASSPAEPGIVDRAAGTTPGGPCLSCDSHTAVSGSYGEGAHVANPSVVEIFTSRFRLRSYDLIPTRLLVGRHEIRSRVPSPHWNHLIRRRPKAGETSTAHMRLRGLSRTSSNGQCCLPQDLWASQTPSKFGQTPLEFVKLDV